MVFNSSMMASVALASADVWQRIACIPERLRSDQLLDLVICFPLQQLGRLVLCIWTILCHPPPDPYNSHFYADEDDDDSDADYRSYYYHAHYD